MVLTSLIEKMNDNQSAKMHQMESTFRMLQTSMQEELEKMRMKLTQSDMGSVSCINCSRGKSPNCLMTPHSNCKSIPLVSNKIL